VNAIAHHAATANSLFEMLAAAEIPNAGAPAGSLFHSILQAATDAEDHPQATSADQAPALDNAPTVALAAPPQRAATQSIALNMFRFSGTPATNEAKNAQPSSASQPILVEAAAAIAAQRSAPPPFALNISSRTPAANEAKNQPSSSTSQAILVETAPALAAQSNYTADENEENASEAPSMSQTNPAETVSALRAQPSGPLPIALNLFAANYNPDKNARENSPARLTAQPATDAGISPKIKLARKDSTADVVPVAVVAVPAQQTVTLPIALNIFPAGDANGKDDQQTTDAPSTKTGQSARGKVAEAPVSPRMALSVAPRSATETQTDPDQPPTVNARAADASLSKLEPAFEMRLQPEPQESLGPIAAVAPSSEPQVSPPAKANMAELASEAAPQAQETAPSEAPAASASSKQGDGSRHPAQERPQETASLAPQPPASTDNAQTNFDTSALIAPAASAISATHVASHSEVPAEAAATDPMPQPGATAPAAHDIKLELNGGGERVEVRLTERGGDVHVAVRTPDARLLDAMRQDLPALAAKLEQSGFRADAWQPGAANASERRAVETAAGNASQDSQERAGQNQQQKQDNPQQQQPKNFTNAANRKSDRKDFAWLLQNYR
jgi:hypothetical protein